MGILNEKVTERRDELTRALYRMGITRSSDGRFITGLPLAELEMMNIEVINKALREERLIAQEEKQIQC